MTGRLRGLAGALEPHPRLVDWSILLLVAFELASGVVSLGAGHPSSRALFVAHGVVGLVLAFLIGYKLRRVRRRLTDRRQWDRATPLSALTAVVALSALGTGAAWVFGWNVRVAYWNLLNVHVLFGLLLLPLVALHLRARFRPPRRRDVEGRRTALRFGALLVGGVLLWRAQQLATALFETAGANRRFTGSRPAEGGDAGGNDAFPATSWVADDPDPVDPSSWTLRVDGEVRTPLELGSDDLSGAAHRRAVLDCTSGWYADQEWRGVRVGDLLERAAPAAEARWVTFHSVTGYRWSLPIAEARGALLATHVGGERLSHGHGFPLRLVAPDRRGFQWVKWVEAVELRRRRDPAQWVAVFASGFD